MASQNKDVPCPPSPSPPSWDIASAELPLPFAQFAMDKTNDAIFWHDAEGHFLYVNQTACRSLGYTPQELLGRSMRETTPNLSSAQWMAMWAKSQICGVFSYESQQKRKDGTLFPVEITAHYLHHDGKELSCTVVRDMTDQQRQTEDMRRTKEAAEAASRAKSVFLANMSHEIRTPMNAIIGLADLMWDTPLNDEQRKYVRIFKQAGTTLLNLLNDALDLTKIEAGHVELQTVEFDLRELLEKIMDILGMRAQEKGLELTSYVAPDVPRRFIGDPHRLEQILMNLISNALKFTGQGEVIVRVERAPEPDLDKHIRFSVADTGIGIPPSQRELIFEHYFQVNSTDRTEGSGLGLAIVKQLVKLLDGHIWVESHTDRGSTFFFTARLKPHSTEHDHTLFRQQPLTGLNMLIADPNRTSSLSLRQALTGWGATVSENDTGDTLLAEVLRADAEQEPFHLIIIDRRVAGRETFQLAQTIKQETLQTTPAILLLLAEGWAEDIRRIYELELGGYLLKPIKHTDLLDSVGIALNKARGMSPVPFKSHRATTITTPHPLRILLVEDSPDNQFLVRSYLHVTPHHLDIADNGQIAFDKFQQSHYDLVIMDMQMPVMDGYATTVAIRHWEKERGRRPIPIVALSAYALEEEEKRSLEAGCTIHLTKPIKKLPFLEAIHTYSTHSPAPPVPTVNTRIRIGIDPQVFPLVPTYLSNRRLDIEKIQKALDQNNLKEIHLLGHRMRGDGSGYGLSAISDIGTSFEKAAEENDVEDIRRTLIKLTTFLDKVEVFENKSGLDEPNGPPSKQSMH